MKSSKNFKKEIDGKLDRHRFGYGFVLRDDGIKPDIYISSQNLKGAMDNDRVRVKVKSKASSSKPEGIIVKILKRGSLETAGTFIRKKKKEYVKPLGSGREKINLIKTPLLKKAKNNDRVHIRIEEPPRGGRMAKARILSVIGRSGEYDTEAEVTLIHSGIRKKFPAPVIKAAEKSSTAAGKKEKIKREDLSNINCFTIDPESAKDFDDAVSIKKSSSGYELGVHIADVSCFVRENSSIDREAYRRGTSVYLPGRVIPMLPESISNNACSLVPGKERKAVSVIIKLDREGGVRGFRFLRSLIKSKKRFTYNQVDQILNKRGSGKEDNLSADIRVMAELARKLSLKRKKRGSIDFEFPEIKLELKDDGKVKEVVREERTLSHRLIEEFMILCNEAVASYMSKNKIPGIYRVHEKPDREKMDAFRDFIALFGFSLPGNSKITPKDLQKILEKIKKSREEVVISTMMLRSLKQAVYSGLDGGHFALASRHYTHFTSPIRRYPDLLVHRLICEVIHRGSLGPSRRKRYRENMNRWAKNLSEKERSASSAEMEIKELKIMEYMKERVGEEFMGIISGITSFGIFVELKMGLEGLIHIRKLKGDYYVFDREKMVLRGRKRKKSFAIGENLKVKLVRIDLKKRQVDFLPA